MSASAHAAWRSALERARSTDTDDDWAAEQRAFDTAVDAVEVAGLNGSPWDPRGPLE